MNYIKEYLLEYLLEIRDLHYRVFLEDHECNLLFKKYTKIEFYNKKEWYKIKYIRLRPMSWYVRMTGLFPFGRPLIVTWTVP